jgi:hypothetical protein
LLTFFCQIIGFIQSKVFPPYMEISIQAKIPANKWNDSFGKFDSFVFVFIFKKSCLAQLNFFSTHLKLFSTQLQYIYINKKYKKNLRVAEPLTGSDRTTLRFSSILNAQYTQLDINSNVFFSTLQCNQLDKIALKNLLFNVINLTKLLLKRS